MTATLQQPTISYLATRLSPNIGETEAGFVICTGAQLARTGWQTYLLRELPPEAQELCDSTDPNAEVNVYRPPEEVFSGEAIASFNGAPVTMGHPPSGEFLDPNNVQYLEYGTVMNARRGEEPLENGDQILVGDIIIKREPLLSDVKSGRLRQLSAGYTYTPVRDGDKLIQTEIRGNHVALVSAGRAGSAKIIDHAMERENMTDREFRSTVRDLLAIANRHPAASEDIHSRAARDTWHPQALNPAQIDANESARRLRTCDAANALNSLNERYASMHGKPLKSSSPPAPTGPTSLSALLDQAASEHRKRAFDSGEPPLSDHEQLQLQALVTGPVHFGGKF